MGERGRTYQFKGNNMINKFNNNWNKVPSNTRLNKKLRKFNKKLNNNKYDTKMKLLSARNSIYRLQLKNRATKEEIIFGNYLQSIGVSFKFQKGFIVPFHRIADFYLPHIETIVEIDGGYHDAIKERDLHKDRVWLNQRGIKTVRFKNESIINQSFKESEFIKSLIKSQF